ncbi:GNAT family N-acetyltransferase [Halobacillus litoralis]|uniref:GNAT family N-acetyltransferase n=1 Tax=Halobacillus litoralis TaxID=45668 RepID=UPI001CFD1762|nr:GNAT family N-acetyltransferase [Halobacillus litoralis]WLR46488.1 GNAT family N-acetyltransferase [Halobacillus litoralis]
MEIRVEELRLEDAEAVLNFEKENRTYFEKMVPSRGDNYYNFDHFMMRHKELLDEQRKKLSYFYLIRRTNGEILGRINLVDIDISQHSGHIGYRVGEKHTGQGVADRALHILMNHLSRGGFTKIFAKTTNNNMASQKVLEKNGFKKGEESDNEFVMNGEKLKFVNYIWAI